MIPDVSRIRELDVESLQCHLSVNLRTNLQNNKILTGRRLPIPFPCAIFCKIPNLNCHVKGIENVVVIIVIMCHKPVTKSNIKLCKILKKLLQFD